MRIMGSRILEINVISAEVVKAVNLFTPTTEAYVVVSVNGDHRSSQPTPIGTVHGSCCYWNHSVRFTTSEAAVLSLVFHVKSKLLLEDVDIATVEIPVAGELFYDDNGNMIATRSLVIDFRDGEVEGVLNFSYKYIDSYRNLAPPSGIMYPLAYPPLPHIAGSLYPPPPLGGYPYGYQQSPFQGYGYEFASEFMVEDDYEDYSEDGFEDYSEDDFEDYFDDFFEDDIEGFANDIEDSEEDSADDFED